MQTANRLDPVDLKTLTLLAYCQALTHDLETAVLTARRVHSFKEHNGYAYAHMIAATALEHGLTVVTRNVKDFSLFGVPLFNPWGT